MKRTVPKTELKYCDIPQSDYMVLVEDIRIRNDAGAAKIPHFHNVMEIGFCLEGKGQLQIDNEICEYEPGMWSIIPANCFHDTMALPGTRSVWEYLFVDVSKLITEAYMEDPAFYEKVMGRVQMRGFLFARDEQESLRHCAERVFEESREKKNFYRGVIKGSLLAFVMQFARVQSDGQQVDGGQRRTSTIDQILPAFTYIQENYSQPIKIGQLAEICHMSESHFRRIFWENSGMTPTEYLNQFRVRRACDLIYRKKASMEEISHKVGFLTVSTFNRNFKQIMGTSPYQWKMHPTDYRRKLVTEEEPADDPKEDQES